MDQHCSHDIIETKDVTRRKSSPTNGKKDDTRDSDNLTKKNKRKSVFLDETKRQAFREYHRLGLHLR